MDKDTYHKWYKNYKKWAYVDPSPEMTPSPVQLSVLAVILLSGSCYVDLALWGSFQGRAARAMRCVGMVPGPGNTWVHVDFKGPPDFACWRMGFVVYVVARVVMLFKSILRIVIIVVVILHHRFLSFVPGVVAVLERFQVVVVFSHIKAT